MMYKSISLIISELIITARLKTTKPDKNKNIVCTITERDDNINVAV